MPIKDPQARKKHKARWNQRNRTRSNKYAIKWRQKNPALYAKYRYNWYLANHHDWPPDRQRKRCGIIIQLALGSGILERPTTCTKCKTPCKPDGHHEDYKDPYDVRWLCRPCHSKADIARRKRLGIVCKHTPGTRLYQKDYDLINALWATGKHSQVEIGRLLGISNTTVSKIVNGKSKPSSPLSMTKKAIRSRANQQAQKAQQEQE